MLKRLLALPRAPQSSFFLWGPRQAGKSTLLRALYPGAFWVDLLKTRDLVRLSQRPWEFREEVSALAPNRLVVVDEIQKVPPLLDEIHSLIEEQRRIFVLCGSSARKLRRTSANLLGGRADRYELHGLVAPELGADFDLLRMLNHGTLPAHYLHASPQRALRAYVEGYLKEEVLAEGLTRNLPVFSNFLGAAALSDSQTVNFSTIARDCGVAHTTVREYFQILDDTLLGRFLPAYVRRPKRRVTHAPKFYFYDVGVANYLAKRGRLEPGSALFGHAFENWVFHELAAYAQYRERFFDMSYWRLSTGVEVDFVVDDMRCAVEAKASANIHADHLKGLRELRRDHPRVAQRIVVSLVEHPRRTDDGIEILPYPTFVERLWSDDLIR